MKYDPRPVYLVLLALLLATLARYSAGVDRWLEEARLIYEDCLK